MRKDMPANNGRATQGAHDRLIFNAAGHSVKTIDIGGGKVRVQISAAQGVSFEVELARREALAFGLQTLQAAGYAAEASPRTRATTALACAESRAQRANQRAEQIVWEGLEKYDIGETAERVMQEGLHVPKSDPVDYQFNLPFRKVVPARPASAGQEDGQRGDLARPSHVPGAAHKGRQ